MEVMMRFQQINVEGFGRLSQCRLPGLSAGLNVIHGRNGAGKTTIVHFLQGVMCGFANARKMRLLPPQQPGTAGGSITAETSEGRFEIIRHARTDNSDTLAISLLRGSADDVSTLRKSLSRIPENYLSKLFAPCGHTVYDLQGLIQFALDEGVELGARASAGAWLTDKIRELETERAELYRTTPSQGTLLALEQRLKQLESDLAASRATQMSQLAAWQKSLQELRASIEKLTAQRWQQDGDLQSIQTDLTEVQDRLWSTRESIVQEVEMVETPAVQVESEWRIKLEAIDQEIAHIQQVLRDLAASRMRLSVRKADLAGSEVPDMDLAIQRQRHALSLIESQTVQLNSVLSHLQSSASCVCGPQSEHLKTNVETIRQQVWLICQELGRQQAAFQQGLVQTEREGVDRCEHELIRQIQRLRIRRDQLLQDQNRTISDRLLSRTAHEATGCQCDWHQSAIANSFASKETLASSIKSVVRERRVVKSNSRPGDEALELDLLARKSRLQQSIAAITQKRRSAMIELHQLETAAKEFACDRTTQSIQGELTLVQKQLADGQEQWQALTLLQTVLQRTQHKLNLEAISPVIQDASRFLNAMTVGRYVRVKWLMSERELRIVDATDSELPPSALSRGTLEQTILSFRLALCREFQRRGTSFPLVLDDVISDSDESRSNAAIEVLAEFARTHQVLFFTCQEHLVYRFAAHLATVHPLPEAPLQLRRDVMEEVHQRVALTGTAASIMPTSTQIELSLAEKTGAGSSESTGNVSNAVRPHSPDAFWLEATSSVKQIPSLGEQMARRLGALGIRTVGELVDLDPDQVEMPLESLQISISTLRRWQAEARLLCCVPNLTGRDAQILVACGVQSPDELAECDEAALLSRITQLRSQQNRDNSTAWLAQQLEWPNQLQVDRWIRNGRSGRSWRNAADWSAARRIPVRNQTPRSTNRLPRPNPVEQPAMVRLHPEAEPSSSESNLKFYLELESPVVDAPSIGPRTAVRLNAIGINFVSQLVSQDANEIARRLKRREFNAETVRAWQLQSALMCSVPELRGHDAQVLVACRITDAQQLAAMSPQDLFKIVKPFVKSKEGVRLLRSAKTPDLDEVTDWIRYASASPVLRAA